jgi:antitoxin CptB
MRTGGRALYEPCGTIRKVAAGSTPVKHARLLFHRWMTAPDGNEAQLTDDLDVRLRRAAYRAAHRGTKEMDALVGRYADAKLASFDRDGLAHFERFLAIADPTLQAWIFGNESPSGGEFESLVDDIRYFHGLKGLPGRTE